MFSSLNLTLLSLSASQVSLAVPTSFQTTRFSISRISVHHNYIGSFLFSRQATKSSVNFDLSHFSHFLFPVLRLEETVFHRDDINGRPKNVDLAAANVTVTESFFVDCKANDGGAFFVVFNGKVIVDKSNFVNCTCDDKGGVLFFYGQSLSFTKSCSSRCAAAGGGFVIFCSRTKAAATIENCHFFASSGKTTTAFIRGFDILLNGNNCSNSKATGSVAAFALIPSHSFKFEQQTLYDNSGEAVLYFEATDQTDLIQDVNTINNDMRNSMFSFKGATTFVNRWSFVVQKDSYRLSESDDNSTLQVSASYFNLAKDKITIDENVKYESNVKFRDSTTISLNFVDTQICWSQNRYKFVDPPLYKKIIIACVVIAIFIAGFIYIIVEACKDEKEHKELLKSTEYNEQMNNEVQLDDLDNLAKKKKYQEALINKGKDGEGEMSD